MNTTTATIEVRPMTGADLPAACALWAQAEGVELAEGDSEQELLAYLRRNPGASQVALADGALVGAVLAGHDGRRGFLYHLAVSPAARGRGVGRQLVEASLKVLKADGIVRVLILVASDNELGAEFWRRRGWERLEFAHAMGLDL
jgi:N-acetylglutamate synthase